MAGVYYTESQKKAIKKYFDKLKAEGRPRSHGDREKQKHDQYVKNTINLIKYLFK